MTDGEAQYDALQAYEQLDIERRKRIVAALMKPFPSGAVKQREGPRGKMLDYLEGHTVLHRLIDVTDGAYRARITDRWVQDNFLYIAVALEIVGLDGEYPGIGVARIDAKGEDLAKGALTDAIKNAAKNAGVGLELYGEDYEAPPPPPSIRKQLNEALKAQGITGAQVAEATQAKFKKGPKDLTDTEVTEWLGELQKTKAPF